MARLLARALVIVALMHVVGTLLAILLWPLEPWAPVQAHATLKTHTVRFSRCVYWRHWRANERVAVHFCKGPRA